MNVPQKFLVRARSRAHLQARAHRLQQPRVCYRAARAHRLQHPGYATEQPFPVSKRVRYNLRHANDCRGLRRLLWGILLGALARVRPGSTYEHHTLRAVRGQNGMAPCFTLRDQAVVRHLVVGVGQVLREHVPLGHLHQEPGGEEPGSLGSMDNGQRPVTHGTGIVSLCVRITDATALHLNCYRAFR